MIFKHKGYVMAFCLIPLALGLTLYIPAMGLALTFAAISLPFLFPYTKMQACPYCSRKKIPVNNDDKYKICPRCQKNCVVKKGVIQKGE